MRGALTANTVDSGYNFFISHGSAKLVLVDDRPETGTKGQMSTFVLT